MRSSCSAKWRRCDDWTLQTFGRYYYQSVLAWPGERASGGWSVQPDEDAGADGPSADACGDWGRVVRRLRQLQQPPPLRYRRTHDRPIVATVSQQQQLQPRRPQSWRLADVSEAGAMLRPDSGASTADCASRPPVWICTDGIATATPPRECRLLRPQLPPLLQLHCC